MSDAPPPGLPPVSGPTGYPPASVPPMPWPPAPVRQPARWPTFVMLLITLVAVGAAIAAWLRPIPPAAPSAPPKPTFSDQQVAEAKSKVCAAYEKTHRAVDANATRNVGDDPTAQLVVKVNMRQIYVVSSAYLFTTLADAPATPADLAANTRKLANLLQELVLDGLASDPATPYDAVNETGVTIESLCK
jgi:hypothetical protein